MAMIVNSCNLTKLGRKLSRLNDNGYLLTCLRISRLGYYITLTVSGAGNWSANTKTYLV